MRTVWLAKPAVLSDEKVEPAVMPGIAPRLISMASPERPKKLKSAAVAGTTNHRLAVKLATAAIRNLCMVQIGQDIFSADVADGRRYEKQGSRASRDPSVA